ncbi:MAG: DUF3006 domain-containing protein [Gammaproteobacteria bacterium]|nr:DUF3006 domain-containing protein [Gammaproteobacteria bacterium]
MNLTIDRFEGNFAVCETETREMVNIPLLVLPGAVEGDIINIVIDKSETEQQRKKIEKLMNDVWED